MYEEEPLRFLYKETDVYHRRLYLVNELNFIIENFCVILSLYHGKEKHKKFNSKRMEVINPPSVLLQWDFMPSLNDCCAFNRFVEL